MSYYKQQYSGGPIMENDYITAAVVFIGIISAIVGNIQHRNELAKKRAKNTRPRQKAQ